MTLAVIVLGRCAQLYVNALVCIIALSLRRTLRIGLEVRLHRTVLLKGPVVRCIAGVLDPSLVTQLAVMLGHERTINDLLLSNTNLVVHQTVLLHNIAESNKLLSKTLQSLCVHQ